MKNSEEITNALNELAYELQRSKKHETAKFFSDFAARIDLLCDQETFIAVLDEIRSSGAISQYANFSNKQDQLLDLIFTECDKLAQSYGK